MIKIGHISDVHLGYSSGKRINKQGINLRQMDGFNAWEEATEQMIAEKIDVAIIAGDIFHMAHPDIRTIMEAQKGLRKLADNDIKVRVIAGNHDATDVRAEIPANGVLHEPFHNIYSYTDPYVIEEVMPGIHLHYLSHHAYTDQGETMKSIKLIPNEINILVSHGSVFDTNMNILLHSPQEPREVVIPEDIMNLPWDYTFLGHIHERGWIGSKDGISDSAKRKQFYGGSTIRRGFTDRPCKLGRGWTLWTIDDNKEFTPTFFDVKQRPQIDCPKIDASELTPSEIEDKIVSQLKDIFNQYKNDDNTINNELAPIVRQTLIGITPVSYVAINWSNPANYSKHFFTYTLKRVDSNSTGNDEDSLSADIEGASAKNIIEAFDDWIDEAHPDNKEIDNKENVVEKAKKLLKKGQDEVLENGED